MTILRPCIDARSIFRKHDKCTAPLDILRQQAADLFWRWAEKRIATHSDKLCGISVKSITEILAGAIPSDSRFQLVLTSSVSTLDTQSPFDRLSDHLSRAGFAAIRLRGHSNLTIENVQVSLVCGALGVSTPIVFSEGSKTGVSMKGLDLSVLEDVGLDRDIAVIIEEGDSVEKSLLFEIIKLVFNFHAKQRPQGRSISLILESDLGESMIEDVVDDEYIFSNIFVSKCPLIDARELNGNIRRIFFGPGSEGNLSRYPIQFSRSDSDFLAKQLPSMSLSPMELCEHILAIVRKWFKECNFSYVVGCVAEGGKSEDKICENLQRDTFKVFEELVVDAKLLKSIKLTKSSSSCFQELLMNSLDAQERLAILWRILVNVGKAVIDGAVASLDSIDDLTTIRFTGSIELLSKLSDKCLADIRSRRKEGRSADDIVSNTVRLNEELIEMLVNELGISRDSGAIDSIVFLNEQIRPLSCRKFNQTKILDEYFDILKRFLAKSMQLVVTQDPSLTNQQEIVHSLFRLAKPESCSDKFLIDVGHFDSFVSFLRSGSCLPENNPGLGEILQVARLIYGPNDKKAKKGKLSHNQIDFDLITETFPAAMGNTLAESLATLEYIGLIRPPGVVDLAFTSSTIKVRKIYKDTPLIKGGNIASVQDSNDEDSE